MNEERKKVVCFGEVLWDVYPEFKKLGGAPFNVAGHLRKLGFEVRMISRVGKDDLGKEILVEINVQNIPRDLIQVDLEYPTGIVNVKLDDEGKPTYEIVQPVAWDFIELDDRTRDHVREADLFLFGTLACRHEKSRSSLLELLDLNTSTVFDMNLRQHFFSQELITHLLKKTRILKLNDEEYDVLHRIFNVSRDNLYNFLKQRYEIQLIVQTRGAEGAEVYDGEQVYQNSGYRIEVVDTVGSGDAFLAGFLTNLLSGNSIEASLDFACRLGAYVATQPGAILHMNWMICIQ
ncbi:MAG: carbohydrate kinase [Saprospiraceae bacterium]|nr:carbohydrate kinase [Saprospiraceae bacterium]